MCQQAGLTKGITSFRAPKVVLGYCSSSSSLQKLLKAIFLPSFLPHMGSDQADVKAAGMLNALPTFGYSSFVLTDLVLHVAKMLLISQKLW